MLITKMFITCLILDTSILDKIDESEVNSGYTSRVVVLHTTFFAQ